MGHYFLDRQYIEMELLGTPLGGGTYTFSNGKIFLGIRYMNVMFSVREGCKAKLYLNSSYILIPEKFRF